MTRHVIDVVDLFSFRALTRFSSKDVLLSGLLSTGSLDHLGSVDDGQGEAPRGHFMMDETRTSRGKQERSQSIAGTSDQTQLNLTHFGPLDTLPHSPQSPPHPRPSDAPAPALCPLQPSARRLSSHAWNPTSAEFGNLGAPPPPWQRRSFDLHGHRGQSAARFVGF